MPDASTLALFAVAAVTLLVIPGPAVLYIVTRSVDQGRAAGLAFREQRERGHAAASVACPAKSASSRSFTFASWPSPLGA